MEKIANKGFFWIWALIGLFITILIWNLPWRFQVNDDEIMRLLASGAYTGKPESYAVFIHPILSWTFSKLYLIAPHIEWYPATWSLVNYCSFLVLLYVTEKGTNFQRFKVLLNLVLLGLLIHLSFFPQFTLIAGFAAVASLSLSSFTKSKFGFVTSLTFFLVALLIRWESVIICTFIAGTLLWLSKSSNKNVLVFKNLYFLVLAIFIISSKWIWEKTSEYKDFLEFNKSRSGVIDHPVFYQNAKEELISKGDEWFFFSRWYFEVGQISTEKLKAKKVLLDKELFTWDQFLNTFERIFEIQKKEAFKSFISLIIFGIFLFSDTKRKWWALLFFGLLFIGLNHFFLLYGRVTLLFFLCLLIPILNKPTQLNNSRTLFGLHLILVLGILFHFSNFLTEARGRKIMEDEMNLLISQIPEDEPIFLEGYQEHMFLSKYNENNPTPFISMGWISRSPFQKQALRRLGYENFEDITSYTLLSIQMDEPVVFPDYMESVISGFNLYETVESDNFVLSRFRKNQ